MLEIIQNIGSGETAGTLRRATVTCDSTIRRAFGASSGTGLDTGASQHRYGVFLSNPNAEPVYIQLAKRDESLDSVVGTDQFTIVLESNGTQFFPIGPNVDIAFQKPAGAAGTLCLLEVGI